LWNGERRRTIATMTALAQRRMLHFSRVVGILAGVYATLDLAIALLYDHWPLLVVGGGTCLVALSTLPVQRLARQGHLEQASVLLGSSLLAAAALTAPLAPYGRASLVLAPIVAVSAVLPHLRGRALAGFMAASFATMVWIVASAAWLGEPFKVGENLGEQIDVVATAAPSMMLFVLLWQFSSQLRAGLDAETDARHKAEEAVLLRDEFLSVASHELRTPLFALQLAVQGLRNGTIAATPENIQRCLDLVNRQVGKLVRLVTDMLTVGSIQVGRVELMLESVDLAEIVRDVAARFASELARARSQLELELAPIVGHWDRNKLDQVVTNLLSNAIKFGAGKPIEVRLDEHEGMARLSVTDRGIGIDPELVPKIFSKFERAVSARAYGGLGLGLFITRTLVEAHGGSVRLDSSQTGRGSRFVVDLPRAGPPAPPGDEAKVGSDA
jgi:signal transduction histidine kinase